MSKKYPPAGQDVIFDGLAEKFARKIYRSKKGELRLALLWEDLQQHIPILAQAPPLHVLDAGGGLGQMSMRLADQGHKVVLCEPSTDMLTIARELIAGGTVASHTITLESCVLQALPHRYSEQSFDVVLCHAVLEWLAEPLPTLAQLLPLLKPGGYLSLAFYNVESIVWKNLLKGNFRKVANREIKGELGSLTPPHPQSAPDVLAWLQTQGLELMNVSGIRCLSDYLHPTANISPDDLLVMERELSQQEPYKWLGRYIHVIARRQC